MGDDAPIVLLITQALAAPKGYLRLENAEELIFRDLDRSRFNTERAVELYTTAISKSVRAWVKERELGRSVFKEYRRSGLGRKFAVELVEKFKAQFRPPLEDQWRPRWRLRIFRGR
jgi:hypothetical protein